MAEPVPRETIYVNNLNEKVSKDELKKSLYAAFSQFGPILDVSAQKTFKMRGQAFIVFRDITAATQAVRQMQGFPFYEKPMMIAYANSKSDAVAKLDGSYEAKDKAERAAKRKAEREERQEAKKAGLTKPVEVAEAGVATPAAGEAGVFFFVFPPMSAVRRRWPCSRTVVRRSASARRAVREFGEESAGLLLELYD